MPSLCSEPGCNRTLGSCKTCQGGALKIMDALQETGAPMHVLHKMRPIIDQAISEAVAGRVAELNRPDSGPVAE